MSIHMAIRLEANFNVGMGHLIRCQALMNILLGENFLISIFISEKSKQISNFFDPSIDVIVMPYFENESDDAQWINKYTHEKLLKFDYVLVDNYELSGVWEEIISNESKKVIAIDDLENRKHESDYLIDFGFARNESKYKKLCNSKTKLLLGESYCLLRESFLNNRNLAKEIRDKTQSINSILVTFGATDPHSHTLKVIEHLDKTNVALDIHILTTSLNENLNSLLILSETRSNIFIHYDVTDITSLLLNADLAIGALGGGAIERICLGLPSICLATESNQAYNAEVLSSLMVIKLASDNDLFIEIQKCLTNSFMPEWHRISQSCFDLYDGLGSYRVAHCVFGWVPKITLVPMTDHHCMQLYEWQCEKGSRNFSRNENIPTLSEHKAWYAESLLASTRSMWMLKFNQHNCGYIRLDAMDNYQEVSILVSKDFRRLGIANAAIEAIKFKASALLLATVHPNNTSSIKLFLNAGFVKSSADTYIWNAA